MLLAIDIGNMRTGLAVFKGRRVVSRFSSPTCECKSIEVAVHALKEAKKYPISEICVASVVPELDRIFRIACNKIFHIKPRFVEPQDIGISIKGYDMKQIGVDRLLNALAAYDRYRGPLVVIDAGSCITFDAVSCDGKYLGGAIVPGINLSLRSLHEKTAVLPEVEFARPRSAIGKSTKESIRSGIYHGYAGLIDGQINSISKELRKKPFVIATGGDAKIVSKLSSKINATHPDLTFEGIRLVWEKNHLSTAED